MAWQECDMHAARLQFCWAHACGERISVCSSLLVLRGVCAACDRARLYACGVVAHAAASAWLHGIAWRSGCMCLDVPGSVRSRALGALAVAARSGRGLQLSAECCLMCQPVVACQSLLTAARTSPGCAGSAAAVGLSQAKWG